MRADATSSDLKQRLQAAFATGTLMDLRTGKPEHEHDDLLHGEGWEPSRTIAAATLTDLLTGAEPAAGADRPRALRLAGAKITGPLDLQAVNLVCPVVLRTCWFEKPVNLAEATGLSLHLVHCHLPGLQAEQLTLRGDLILVVLTALGEVNLSNAHVGGQLRLGASSLTNSDGPALNASRLTVDKDLFCSDGFSAQGGVSLSGAHIGGELTFNGAHLTNPNGPALNATRLHVGWDMLCGDGFAAQGEVRLIGAHIGGQLAFEKAILLNPGGLALDLQDAQAGTLLLRRLSPPPGLVDLSNARVGVLADDQASWPQQLGLRGFTYDALLEEFPISVRDRLRWLRRDPFGYSPEPYEQLAATYRRIGREEDARRVAIAKQQDRRDKLGWPARLWSFGLGALVGHGYRTGFAGLWLLGLLAVGTLLCAAAYPEQFNEAKPKEEMPAFQPVIYALDVLLPAIDLNQETAWVTTGWVRWWVWASILTGWVLTTAVLAALTGVLKRE